MKKYWNLLLCSFLLVFASCSGNSGEDEVPEGGELVLISSAAVSYTHLTLPTN